MATPSTQAWSFGDGRFSFTAPLGQAPTVGTPVVVTMPDGHDLLGQVGRTVLADGQSGVTADVRDVQVLGDGELVGEPGRQRPTHGALRRRAGRHGAGAGVATVGSSRDWAPPRAWIWVPLARAPSVPSSSRRRGSPGTRSSAASPARARRTPWGCSSSSSCSGPTSRSSSSTRTRTTSTSPRSTGTGSTPRSYAAPRNCRTGSRSSATTG